MIGKKLFIRKLIEKFNWKNDNFFLNPHLIQLIYVFLCSFNWWKNIWLPFKYFTFHFDFPWYSFSFHIVRKEKKKKKEMSSISSYQLVCI